MKLEDLVEDASTCNEKGIHDKVQHGALTLIKLRVWKASASRDSEKTNILVVHITSQEHYSKLRSLNISKKNETNKIWDADDDLKSSEMTFSFHGVGIRTAGRLRQTEGWPEFTRSQPR